VAAELYKVRLAQRGAAGDGDGQAQIGAAICWAPLAISRMPAAMPSLKAWLMVAALGVFCTAVAYILYFRLIARLGPARRNRDVYGAGFWDVVGADLFERKGYLADGGGDGGHLDGAC